MYKSVLAAQQSPFASNKLLIGSFNSSWNSLSDSRTRGLQPLLPFWNPQSQQQCPVYTAANSVCRGAKVKRVWFIFLFFYYSSIFLIYYTETTKKLNSWRELRQSMLCLWVNRFHIRIYENVLTGWIHVDSSSLHLSKRISSILTYFVWNRTERWATLKFY